MFAENDNDRAQLLIAGLLGLSGGNFAGGLSGLSGGNFAAGLSSLSGDKFAGCCMLYSR